MREKQDELARIKALGANKAKEIKFIEQGTCPTCGAPLSEEKIEKISQEFNKKINGQNKEIIKLNKKITEQNDRINQQDMEIIKFRKKIKNQDNKFAILSESNNQSEKSSIKMKD